VRSGLVSQNRDCWPAFPEECGLEAKTRGPADESRETTPFRETDRTDRTGEQSCDA